MSSHIILLDGISGSGKGGRIKTLVDFLGKDCGQDVTEFREPSYLRDDITAFRRDPHRDPREEMELFIADRKLGLKDYEHVIDNDGFVAVGDRSFISTMVYQSLQGIPVEEIRQRHEFYPRPDLAFILLCDPDVAVSRIHAREIADGTPVNLDETLEKITRLRDRYLAVAQELPYAHVINTNGRPEAIDLVLQSHVKGYLGIPMKKAIFLDKDGTLVDNSRYPEVIPTDDIFPGSYEALRDAESKGYGLFIISSQPWAAQGRMTTDEVEDVFTSVVRKYDEQGITIKGYGYCAHNRSENCPDKKPSTRLFESFVRDHNIDTRNSYMVGDMDNDIIAGYNMGLKTVRIRSEHANVSNPDYTIGSISDLSSVID